jgi:hypothetical protein
VGWGVDESAVAARLRPSRSYGKDGDLVTVAPSPYVGRVGWGVDE